ncbi:MAG: hypothetical protein VX670_10675, partial [Candidatus Latescibacterota bacterium]|nr:hypothetical protein [Candidatus Latescibacterota bacterium]
EPAAEWLADAQRLGPVEIAGIGHPDGSLMNQPAGWGVEESVRARLNNALLPQADTAGGWLVFAVPYDALARGENLLGIGALGRELRVEKVEVRVCCTEVL